MRSSAIRSVVLLAWLAVAAGCGGSAAVEFRSLSWMGGRTPDVVVVAGPEAFASIWERLPYAGDPPPVAGDEIVIGVLLGERPTGGYGIFVREIHRLDRHHVRVRVERIEPQPTDVVTQVISYPGHWVAVPRDQLPRGSFRLTVVDQHETILFEREIEAVR